MLYFIIAVYLNAYTYIITVTTADATNDSTVERQEDVWKARLNEVKAVLHSSKYNNGRVKWTDYSARNASKSTPINAQQKPIAVQSKNNFIKGWICANSKKKNAIAIV